MIRMLKSRDNFGMILSSGDSVAGYLFVEKMAFDSGIFGFSVYRISDFGCFGNQDSENKTIIDVLLSELDQKIRELNIRYITVSINSNNPAQSLFLNTFLQSDFRFINTLLTFKMEKNDFPTLGSDRRKTENLVVRKVEKKDAPAIAALAKKSFRINRFHMDPNLDREKCDLLYAKSAENSILQGFVDVMFVADYKGEIVGYYSGKKAFFSELKTTIGNAVISAVSESVRGMGIFSELNRHLLQWFYDHTDIAEMGTYLNNAPIHKTWTNNRLPLVRGSHQLARFISSLTLP